MSLAQEGREEYYNTALQGVVTARADQSLSRTVKWCWRHSSVRRVSVYRGSLV